MAVREKYNFRKSGRPVFWDTVTGETLQALFPLKYCDDFVGADTVIPAAASPESGCDWVKKITGAAPPTCAKGADAAGGAIYLTGTTASQKQECFIYQNDQRTFDLTKGLIFEARAQIQTLLTGNMTAFIGLAGDYVEDVDAGIVYKAGFYFPAASAIPYCMVDDNTAGAVNVTSATTLTVATYYVFRMECTDITNIKFFINGSEVAAATSKPYTETGANAILQPYVGLYKVSGGGAGIMYLDYVKIWQNRS